VLSQNGSEALDAASHGAVDHDRAGAARGHGLLDQEGLLLLLAVLLVGILSLRGRGRCRSRLCGIRLLLVRMRTLGSLVLKGEVDGLLKVELDGGALPLSLWGGQLSFIGTLGEMIVR
jgi:hypothetical protein